MDTYEIVLRVYEPADISFLKKYFKKVNRIQKGMIEGIINERNLRLIQDHLERQKRLYNYKYEIHYVAKPNPKIHYYLYIKFDKKNASQFALEELTYQIRRNFIEKNDLLDMKIDKEKFVSLIDFYIRKNKVKDLIKFLEDLKKNKWIKSYELKEVYYSIEDIIRSIKV